MCITKPVLYTDFFEGCFSRCCLSSTTLNHLSYRCFQGQHWRHTVLECVACFIVFLNTKSYISFLTTHSLASIHPYCVKHYLYNPNYVGYNFFKRIYWTLILLDLSPKFASFACDLDGKCFNANIIGLNFRGCLYSLFPSNLSWRES